MHTIRTRVAQTITLMALFVVVVVPGWNYAEAAPRAAARPPSPASDLRDRKSTRLNSSHSQISYAVFCLKKKKKNHNRAELEGKNQQHFHTKHSGDSDCQTENELPPQQAPPQASRKPHLVTYSRLERTDV